MVKEIGARAICARCDLEIEWWGEDWRDRGNNVCCRTGQPHTDRPLTPAEKERDAALARLREWLHPGDTVYTILRHVSRSGMQRHISVLLLQPQPDGTIMDLHPNHAVASAIGWRLTPRGLLYDAVIASGAGMDMGFHLVDTLSSALGMPLKQRWL